MKSRKISSTDLNKMLLDGDQEQQNRALQSLYSSPIVNAKVREWAKMYNLKDKEPDDVLQEAVILLYELVLEGRFRGDSKAETFLLGICKNIIRDSVKKVNRIQFKESFTDADLHSEDQLADQIVVTELSDLEHLRDTELVKTIGQLTDNCQEALKLYYFESKTMAYIAEKRQLANPEQAKKAVHRCRESLRKLVQANSTLLSILNQLL